MPLTPASAKVAMPLWLATAALMMPMASVASPDGKYLIVLCGGYNPPSLIVLEEGTLKELGRVRVADGWLGLAINKALQPTMALEDIQMLVG